MMAPYPSDALVTISQCNFLQCNASDAETRAPPLGTAHYLILLVLLLPLLLLVLSYTSTVWRRLSLMYSRKGRSKGAKTSKMPDPSSALC